MKAEFLNRPCLYKLAGRADVGQKGTDLIIKETDPAEYCCLSRGGNEINSWAVVFLDLGLFLNNVLHYSHKLLLLLLLLLLFMKKIYYIYIFLCSKF